MEERLTGLSHELVIHPGETLRELLEDRGMSQKKLAMCTGFSEKHISMVLNGKSSITAAFASKLEDVFEVNGLFWLNLQSNYDLEKIALHTGKTKNIAESVAECSPSYINR